MGLESIQDFFNQQIRNVASNNLAENITNNMQNSNIKFDANQMTTFFLLIRNQPQNQDQVLHSSTCIVHKGNTENLDIL